MYVVTQTQVQPEPPEEGMHASPTKADPTPVELYTSPPATSTGPAAAPYVVSAPTPALSPAVLSTNQVVQVAPPVHQQQVRAITVSTCANILVGTEQRANL